VATPGRGPGIILPAIVLGRDLRACEDLPGFERLLPRIQRGDRSAFSELRFAAALTRLNLRPEIEPQLGSTVLDTAVDYEGTQVYCEVIAPERADAITSIQPAIQALAETIRDRVTGSVLEVLLDTDIGPETSAAVLDVLPRVSGPDPVEFEGLGTFVRRPASIPLQLGPTIFAPRGGRPVLGAAAGGIDGSVVSAGIVRVPVQDARARRLLAAELHHFSRDAHNLLAIDMTDVTANSQAWASLIQRSFQPKQNKRIGGVIFFWQALVGPPVEVRQWWTVLPNEHANRPIAAELLAMIESLDESVPVRAEPAQEPER